MAYRVEIRQGNLLDEPDATFIVNASNTELKLGSGVSAAFRDHCGDVLQELMDSRYLELTAEGKTIRKGDAVLTPPGKAKNIVYAIHVAIMDYSGQGTVFPSAETVLKGLENIERLVREYGNVTANSKLVMPLMGCGVGGLDKKRVVGIYKRFFERDPGFECRVVIYGHSEYDYDLIKKGFGF